MTNPNRDLKAFFETFGNQENDPSHPFYRGDDEDPNRQEWAEIQRQEQALIDESDKEDADEIEDEHFGVIDNDDHGNGTNREQQ